jgi:hypothetical protein
MSRRGTHGQDAQDARVTSERVCVQYSQDFLRRGEGWRFLHAMAVRAWRQHVLALRAFR